MSSCGRHKFFGFQRWKMGLPQSLHVESHCTEGLPNRFQNGSKTIPKQFTEEFSNRLEPFPNRFEWIAGRPSKMIPKRSKTVPKRCPKEPCFTKRPGENCQYVPGQHLWAHLLCQWETREGWVVYWCLSAMSGLTPRVQAAPKQPIWERRSCKARAL